ncbi:hypothetical protein B6U81_07365 [Thermoplasmatales archaeon ex4484_30]|nr:MAG: hypothetical protein B6U81_07365 [Thermoplasmatales archaeon ex4484_30]
MKKEIRILGIDDMPFSFEDEYVDIVGVILRGNSYIEGVIKATIEVDGMDATPVIISLIKNTKHRGQLKVIMIDGIALGGFNVVDGGRIYDEAGIPVLTITRNKPHSEKIKEALQKHFEDWEERWNIINKGRTEELCGKYPLYIKRFGIGIKEAEEVIKISTIRGAIPEPLRIAHLIATGIKTGESYGKA